MKSCIKALLASLLFVLCARPALADDLEGTLESIDADASSFMVQGITFLATDATDYDDGLKGFDSLQQGQRVEVDFDYRDGKHVATEVELED